jgi:sugar/nucleoside kinase (ribokinase family)
MFDVGVVGDLNADLILSGDVAPAFGQVERLLDDATLVLGSSAAIFACGAARLGLRVAFIGKVGDDVFGRFVCDELAARGINTDGVIRDPAIKTGLTVILARGVERALLTYPGSIAALCYRDVDSALLARARHVHIGSYFLLDALRPDIPALCDLAHRHGLTISLDTNYDPAERWQVGDLLRHIDIFLPNEAELCAIAAVGDLDAALDKLSRQTPLIAVKRGAQGAIARRGAEQAQTASIPVAVVDTTGAGDSFDAGFVCGYLAGQSLGEALRMGVVCGALSTRAAGGTTAQPTLEEVQSVMRFPPDSSNREC